MSTFFKVVYHFFEDEDRKTPSGYTDIELFSIKNDTTSLVRKFDDYHKDNELELESFLDGVSWSSKKEVRVITERVFDRPEDF